MVQKWTISEFIAKCEILSRLCNSLNGLYHSIEPVIKSEKAAIEKRSFEEIEKFTDKKVDLSDSIVKKVNELRNLTDEFVAQLQAQENVESKLREIPDILKELRSTYNNLSFLEDKVLEKLVSEIEARCTQLKDNAVHIHPYIEQNQIIIRKLLTHQQESYRFWQDLHRKAEAVYTQKGTQIGQSGESVFKLKV